MGVNDRISTRRDDPRRRRSFVVGVAAIVCCGLLAFWPILGADFCLWDDPLTIVGNPALNPPTLAGLAARWTTPDLHLYAPLAHTAWHAIARLAYDPGGAAHNDAGTAMRPWPFKAASVAAHLLTSVIVFAIARRLVGARWPALVAAIVFCVHPLQVEAVGWTSGLKDLLCATFIASTVLFWLDPRRGSVIAALATAILAMLSKPTAMVLPAMLLVVDVAWLRRPIRAALVRVVPLALAAIACAIVARAAQGPAGAESTVAPLMRPLVVGWVYAFYVVKALAPAGLAFDYGLTPTIIASRATIAVAWLVPVAVAAVAWRARRRVPLVGVGLLLAAIPLLPVSGVVWFDFARVSTTADHYATPAMIGGAIALAGALSIVRRRPGAIALSVVAIAVLIGLTMRQAMTWHDADRVARRTLAVNPRSFTSWNHLGAIAARSGRPADAEALMRRAIAIAPDDLPTLLSLGSLASGRGDDAAAAGWYGKALAASPTSAAAWRGLAVAEAHLGDGAAATEAIGHASRFEGDPAVASRAERALRAEIATTRPTGERSGTEGVP